MAPTTMTGDKIEHSYATSTAKAKIEPPKYATSHKTIYYKDKFIDKSP